MSEEMIKTKQVIDKPVEYGVTPLLQAPGVFRLTRIVVSNVHTKRLPYCGDTPVDDLDPVDAFAVQWASSDPLNPDKGMMIYTLPGWTTEARPDHVVVVQCMEIGAHSLVFRQPGAHTTVSATVTVWGIPGEGEESG